MNLHQTTIMKLRYFITLLALQSWAIALEKPNIVFILADDQGVGDVSALNPNGKIPTPSIDRIANEGMVFTDAHSSSSVCTPTRYSVLTGRYHWRTKLQSGVLGGFSPPLIAEDRLTVAGFLGQHGYHSACIGKWHLGFDWPKKDGGTADDKGDFSGGFKGVWNVDYTAPIQNGPVDVGFDHFWGISASLDMPPYVYINDRTPTEPATVEKAFHRKGPAAASFEAVNVLPDITREAVRYIGERAAAAKEGKPFFLYFPLNAPHTPIVPTDEWKGKSGLNIYGDFTMQVDATVGQILDALDEHGLTNDTLVIFTTDNGCSPQANFKELKVKGHEPSHIYRGHKADIFEGGHRVPFVVRWPGKVKAGSVTDQLIGQFDLMATCADVLGKELPATAGEDSVSILPVLMGTAEDPVRDQLVSQSINGSFAIRSGNWKLALCPGSGGWSSPKPNEYDAATMPPVQLYDLSKDPGETTNLAVKDSSRVEEMKAMLTDLIARGRSTPGPELNNDVEVRMMKSSSKRGK